MFHGKEPRVNSTSEGNKAKEKPHHRPCLLAATADRAEKQESSHGKKEEDGGGGKEGGGRLRSLFLLLSRSKNPPQKKEGGRGGDRKREKDSEITNKRRGEERTKERSGGRKGGGEGGLWSSRPTQVRLRLLLASAFLVYRAKVEGEDLPLHCDAMLPKRGVCGSKKLLFTPLHLILHSIGDYGFALQRRFLKSKINFKESLGSLGSRSFYPELAFSNYS